MLLLSEGQRSRSRVGVDGHTERRRQVVQPDARIALVEDQPLVGAEHQVLEDGQCRDQAQVLVDHADPKVSAASR